MSFKASHKHAPISARKARLVMDMVRGLPVDHALDALRTTHRRAAPMITKVIRSAVANAEQLQAVGSEMLFVEFGVVNEGPLKQGRLRWRPGAQGRAKPYRKRTSHIEVMLGVLEDAAKARRVKAPSKSGTEPSEAEAVVEKTAAPAEEVAEVVAAEEVVTEEVAETPEAEVETAEVEEAPEAGDDKAVEADAETQNKEETPDDSSDDEPRESKD